MEIIAKQKTGYLIEASKQEIKSILTAVNGQAPDDIKLGQKIPAIDYASTINKIKALANDYSYKEILSSADRFNKTIENLKEVVENAASILIE